MAIDRTQQKLLENFKESNLKFLLKITPFSTQISLKNSFVKRHDHNVYHEPLPTSDIHKTEVIRDQERVTSLEAKNCQTHYRGEELLFLEYISSYIVARC